MHQTIIKLFIANKVIDIQWIYASRKSVTIWEAIKRLLDYVKGGKLLNYTIDLVMTCINIFHKEDKMIISTYKCCKNVMHVKFYA